MFQLGFGFGTDLSGTGWVMDTLRLFLATFDVVVYTLISIVYQIIMNVADSQIFSSSTIKGIYNRVELIIGVFMIFKLSISILQVIINPDLLSDKKAGLGQVITRIVTMLAMLTAIVPLSIPASETNSKNYNSYLNDDGLLFGTMYYFQHAMLQNNILEKIILGKDEGNTYKQDSSNKSASKRIAAAGDRMALYVLKGFINVNKDSSGNYICAEDSNATTSDLKDAVPVVSFFSKIIKDFNADKSESYYKAFNSSRANPATIASNVNLHCDEGYLFSYFPIISTICGIVLLLTLVAMCLDIAVRAFKLAFLRLLSPIPILSYIDPKSSEKGAFASWVRALTTTYIDLFIRLAIIFFVIEIADNIVKGQIDLPIMEEANVVTVLSTIFIILGAFHFARIAPKFITDSLGLKGIMSNVGLKGMLAATGSMLAGGGLRNSFSAGRAAMANEDQAYSEGKRSPGLMQGGFNAGRDYASQMLTGNDKMSYQQMKRGRDYLAREGITDSTADAQKAKMYKLKDQAEIARALADRVNNNGWGSLTDKERKELKESFEKRHAGDEKYNRLSAVDKEALMKSNAAVESYNEASAKAGKAEAKFKDMQTEMQKWGLTEGYRGKYLARPSATMGDLTDSSNWGSIFSGVTEPGASVRQRADSFVSGVRTVAGAPGATVRSHRPFNRDPQAQAVNDRAERDAAIQSDIENRR